MSKAIENTPDLAALQEEIAALKRDVAGLLTSLQGKAGAVAGDAAAKVDAGASRVYRDLAEGGERSLKALGQQIEEQPVLALLIALGIGWIGGRLLTR